MKLRLLLVATITSIMLNPQIPTRVIERQHKIDNIWVASVWTRID